MFVFTFLCEERERERERERVNVFIWGDTCINLDKMPKGKHYSCNSPSLYIWLKLNHISFFFLPFILLGKVSVSDKASNV